MRHRSFATVCAILVLAVAVPLACVNDNAAPPLTDDAGFSFDSAVAPFDTGIGPTVDAPVDAAPDTTTAPMDAGSPPTDSGIPPVDAGDAAEASTLLSGLLAWYQAEGNANDFTGAYNGTLFGEDDASVTFVAGRDGGQAFALPGANAEIDIPNGIIPASATSYTIAAWTWTLPASLNAEQHQIVYTGSLRGELFLTLDLHNLIDFTIHTAEDSWPAAYSPTTDAGLATGTWVSVVGVRRETAIELWIGGTMVTTGAIDEDAGMYVDDAGTSSSIGGEDGTNWYWGYLDDIRFYGRALSPAEIQEL
jgi:hypothetical protein